MSDSFAAAPGTCLVIAPALPGHEPSFIPVLGWMNTKGARVAPLTAQHGIPFKHGVAVVVPGVDGALLHDPTYQRVFDTVTEWLDYLGAEEKEGEEGDAFPIEVTSGAEYGVLFDMEKTYVKLSYWHFKEGFKEFLFEVEGGDFLPDDGRVTKTNRRDFMQLKKTIPVLSMGNSLQAPSVDNTEEDDIGDLI